MAGAGLLGGALTWLAFQIIPDFDSSFVSNLVFTFTMVFLIGLTVAMVDALRSGSLEKAGRTALVAVPVALVAALIFGLAAHALYSAGTDYLIEEAFQREADGQSGASIISWFTMLMHPIRGLAWGIVGAAAGLVVGAASLSVKRTIITVTGGFIGGFLGGFLFDFFGSEGVAQFVGFAVTGTLVGLAMGALEEVRKSTWIEIAAGGMAGKQFILYQDAVTIGSSPACNITVIKDPAVQPEAATIVRRGSASRLQAAPGAPVNVDGVMQADAQLRDGAVIILGSTTLVFREKASNTAQVGSIRA